MYRLEAMVFLLASIPFVMACIYAIKVAPRRKTNMRISLQAAARMPEPSAPHEQETNDVIAQGAERVERDFESLYSSRLLIPAFLLSLLYALGFSLGLSVLLPDNTYGFLIRPFTAFGAHRAFFLSGPAFAIVGAYTFNTGVLVRRAFMADFSKNVMWSCINRLILSLGFSVFLLAFRITGVTTGSITYYAARNATCFAIAFFPSVFITAMRKRTRKALGVGSSTSELDIQLIQGIDVWKEERLSEEGIESVQNMATADIFGLLPKVHFSLRTIVDWMDQAIFIQRFPFAYLKWQEAGFAVSAIRFAAIVDPSLTGATPHAAMQAASQSMQGASQSMQGSSPAAAEPTGVATSAHSEQQSSAAPTIASTIHAQAAALATPVGANGAAEPAALYTQASIIAGQPAPDITLLQSMAHASGIDLPVLREALTSLSNDASIRVLARLWQSGALVE